MLSATCKHTHTHAHTSHHHAPPLHPPHRLAFIHVPRLNSTELLAHCVTTPPHPSHNAPTSMASTMQTLSPPHSTTSTKSTHLTNTHPHSSPLRPCSRSGPVNEHLLNHIRIGDDLEIWWPLDRQYYRGRVAAALPHGHHRIEYDDGDVERLYLPAEQWRFCGAAAERVIVALGLATQIARDKRGAAVVRGESLRGRATKRRRSQHVGGRGVRW